MKPADCPTGNGEEAKWKYFPGENRTVAIHESSERRHEHVRTDEKDSCCERKYRASFYEGAEIVTWREQKPNRQSGSRKTINDDGKGQRNAGQSKHVRPRRRIRDPLACYDDKQNERHADE